MQTVTKADLQKLYISPSGSHKGQNGRLLLIGGSQLFHSASLWPLTVASRIVDLVHYCSIPENNQIVHEAKSEFRNGIVISRADIDDYIEEDDCILIGPGMTRDPVTEELTNRLLKKYPHKQWVIDAGALQMMDVSLMPQYAIVTPHGGEFLGLLKRAPVHLDKNAKQVTETSEVDLDQAKLESLLALVRKFAQAHNCIVLLKGTIDIACSKTESRTISGGNAGMTKGGTGDVLAGLIAALACKNDPFLATIAGSFINKSAGDELYKTVGPFFNATDLANEIPRIMTQLIK